MAAQAVPSFLCEITPFKQKFLQEQVVSETLEDSIRICPSSINFAVVLGNSWFCRKGVPLAFSTMSPSWMMIHNDCVLCIGLLALGSQGISCGLASMIFFNLYIAASCSSSSFVCEALPDGRWDDTELGLLGAGFSCKQQGCIDSFIIELS